MQKISLHTQMFSANFEPGESAGRFGVAATDGYKGLKGIRGKKELNMKKKAVTLRW